MDRSYSRLGNWARFLGLVFRPALTPNERADLLARSVPEGKEPIYSLTDQYVRQRFSRRREVDAGFKPSREWQLLRPKLIRRVISYQLKYILKGIRKG